MKTLKFFKAPFFNSYEIQKKADQFRKRYAAAGIPVDIEDIIEFELKLGIRPVSDLYLKCNTNAYLTADCSSIVVDEGQYLNPRNLFPLRFSLAHEVGHLVLHKDIVNKFRPGSIDEWKNIMKSIPDREYGFLEYHSHEFAGRLLVPPESLILEIGSCRADIKRTYDQYPDISDDLVIEYVASKIYRKFEVSPEVIARRIKIEKVWKRP
ncbi:MAG: ImmA/IrrE family metallo-endopeptidase [Acidobacteriia bacterium]|nr:ImmA/IrrE family metallo-endopeptidase [Terriglobia bacterium]